MSQISQIDQLKSFFESIKHFNIAVVGETIADEFIPVSYEGQSMKSICPVFQIVADASLQIGGAGAIAGHLNDFVASIDLITNPNDEIKKTRFIDINDRRKHVEINSFNLSNKSVFELDVNNYDAVIVADFGHGFCDHIRINDGFHLMAQTNSNNFGYNRISKWKDKNKKSICIDAREASLQINRKTNFSKETDLYELYNYELYCEKLFVTLGKEGAMSFDGNEIIRHSSYLTQIVDTIGAGDAFFAFSSLIAQLNSDYLFIPSLAASLSTTWLCNEKSITKQTLIDHANKCLH
jgi:bifunctional ADP-heptose synthase (sugar kinase/adenylyltransferase)